MNGYVLQRISVRLLVRRAKLGFASQGQVLTPDVLARYRVPRVASSTLTPTAKRTQGGDGPQCASVKGLSPFRNGPWWVPTCWASRKALSEGPTARAPANTSGSTSRARQPGTVGNS